MNVLMFAHRLEVGGTQVNTIDLAAALQTLHGMTVTLFATPGPLVALARSRGLHYIAAPDAAVHPSLSRARALRAAVRRYRADVVHAWDWWQCLDSCLALRMGSRVPLVITDMMMDLTSVLPKQLPTTFGTPQIVRDAMSAGRRRVELLLPPVDVGQNAPGAVEGAAFRRRYGITTETPLLVTVSRLSSWMKSESLIRTIQSMPRLAPGRTPTLAIVGDGEARVSLEAMAQRVNDGLGRRAILFTGALLDPRPAYAAADIVIGMGGSALRGMAFCKPVVVVGEGGFSAIFDESTADDFRDRGFYGRAVSGQADESLVEQLDQLLGDRARRSAIGLFSRQFVLEHHSLEKVSGQLASLYRRTIDDPVPALALTLDALRTIAVYLRERRFLVRSRGREPVDTVSDVPLTGMPVGMLDRTE